MASDFISIIRDNKDATHAQQVLAAIDTVRNARAQLFKLSSIGKRMSEGEGFALYETKMGVPEGHGKLVFGILENVNTLLADSQVSELIDRIG